MSLLDIELHPIIAQAFGKYVAYNKISISDCEIFTQTLKFLDKDFGGYTILHEKILLKPVNNMHNLCESCKAYIEEQEGVELDFDGIYQYVSVLYEVVKSIIATNYITHTITADDVLKRWRTK